MSKEIREELRGLMVRASKSSWHADECAILRQGDPYRVLVGIMQCESDASLLAATHNVLPVLLDEMDEKDAEIERLKRERDLYKAMYIKTAEGKCDADAKVGALERAIKLECKGSLRSICAKWQPFVGCDRYRKKPCHCHDCDEYQFDQARFEGGGAGEVSRI